MLVHLSYCLTIPLYISCQCNVGGLPSVEDASRDVHSYLDVTNMDTFEDEIVKQYIIE